MNYLLIETDEGNRIPYNINKNHAVDIRMLTKEKIGQLPMWNVVEMDFPDRGFFPDLFCFPCLLLSRCFMETIMMYQHDTPYKAAKLWERKTGINATYFMPVLEEVDCISEKSQYNNNGNRIIKLILDKDKIAPYAVFKIKGYERNCIVGRMDFAESLMRRNVRGVKMTDVLVSNIDGEKSNIYYIWKL